MPYLPDTQAQPLPHGQQGEVRQVLQPTLQMQAQYPPVRLRQQVVVQPYESQEKVLLPEQQSGVRRLPEQTLQPAAAMQEPAQQAMQDQRMQAPQARTVS